MYNKIKTIYPDIMDADFDIQDNSDGKGAFISRWDDVRQQPTTVELASVDTTSLEKSIQVINNRVKSYDTIQDQLDTLYWDGVNGTTNWIDNITAVKTKYPKPIA
jgi:hypothetical protein